LPTRTSIENRERYTFSQLTMVILSTPCCFASWFWYNPKIYPAFAEMFPEALGMDSVAGWGNTRPRKGQGSII